MKSNVQIAGHPIHPIIVPIAIGAIVASLIFNFAMLGSGNSVWFVMSFWTLLVGLCATVFSALTGITDYFTLHMSHQARQQATIHFALNVTWLTILTASLVIKSFYALDGVGLVATWAIIASFVLDVVGILLLLASGWYGGEVVYRHGVGVMDEAADEVRYPQAIGRTAEMGALGGERPPDQDIHEE
ncbi:MAG: DUF2231 domain-containing protein [Armatimonadota bacterium]|nr:DUF2231 domain-containing protein [bacterium]